MFPLSDTLLFVAFFVTGAASLVLEQVWVRELGLVFGSTTLAVSTVLAVFMGGLGLGSLAVARYAQRTQRLRALYAACEIGVGLYALAVPVLLARYPLLARLLHRTFEGSPVGLGLCRFVAAVFLLLLPTTLMGATLPLLSGYLLRRRGARISTTLGTLYAMNTVGAVVGTYLAGFELLPSLGIKTTTLLAAICDIVIGLLIALSRSEEAPLEENADSDCFLASVPEPVPVSERVRTAVQIAFLLSGGAAMMTQVLWNRALGIVLGSSVYSFALILIAFLSGLAIGSALLSRLVEGSPRPLLWLTLNHVAVALLSLFAVLMMDRLPLLFVEILRGGRLVPESILSAQFFLCVLSILPATIAMGGIFPLTLALVVRTRQSAVLDVGRAYAFNTAGAILGSFLAGFVVLPLAGVELGLRGAALLSGVLGVTMFLLDRRRACAAVGAIALVVIVAVLPAWRREILSAGLFRVAIARDILSAKRWRLPELLYYHDGISTTVSVEKWGKTIALKNNGKVDASNGDDMATQILVGLLPLVIHGTTHPLATSPPPKAALVGYGSGVTAGAMLQYPLESLDVIELEPRVVEAGDRYFGDINHYASGDARTRLHMGDGRNFLAVSDQRYDVIVSEPSNPWLTGVSNLFTVEYWRLSKARLAPDGIFCQWAQLYELKSPNIKALLRSFIEVFPNAYVFSAEDLSSDVLLVASPQPLKLDLAALQRMFELEVTRRELARAHVDSPHDLLAALLLSPDELPAFTAGATLITDDNAHLEFAAPRDLLGSLVPDPWPIRIYADGWPYGRIESQLTGLGPPDEAARHYEALALRLLRHGRRQAATRLLDRNQRLIGKASPDGARTRALLGLLQPTDTYAYEAPLTDETSENDKLGLAGLNPPAIASGRAADYLRMEHAARVGAWATALKAIATWPEKAVDDAGFDFQLLLGMLLQKVELHVESKDRLSPLLDRPDKYRQRPAVLYYLARAEFGVGNYAAAVEHMDKYLDYIPTNEAPSVKVTGGATGK